MHKLDSITIKAIELTAPGACSRDAAILYNKLKKGQIFGAFNEQEREEIWGRVLAVSQGRLIPSLFSFFKDLNYLQGPAECMKRLVVLRNNESLSHALKHRVFNVESGKNSYIVQQSHLKFITRPGNIADQVDIGYRQLWMCAMRDYLEISPQKEKKDVLAKATITEDETILCRFGALAFQLGFDTNQIRVLLQRSPDREIARNALLKARNKPRWRYDAAAFERYVEEIVGLFDTAIEASGTEPNTTINGYSSKPPNRCGIPRIQDHNHD